MPDDSIDSSYELYERAIWPVHEVDGDTSDYIEDDGRRSYTVRRERDLGLDTPEMRSSDPAERELAMAAKIARLAWFKTHLACNVKALSWPVVDGTRLFAEYTEIHFFVLRSEKRDSFDRWLSTVRCQAGHSLQQWMLDEGFGTVWTR